MNDYYERNYAAVLPADLDAPILDIGCGAGDFVRFLVRHGYRNITAIDIDMNAVDKLNMIDGVTGIVEQVSPETLPTLGRKWALIIVKQMIYYLPRNESPAFVRSVATALAPSGKAAFEIFNGSTLSSRFTELKDPYILTAYTERSIKHLLEDNGLTVERLCPAITGNGGVRSLLYGAAGAAWFALYCLLLIIERGIDDDLPRIRQKSIIAVARRA